MFRNNKKLISVTMIVIAIISLLTISIIAFLYFKGNSTITNGEKCKQVTKDFMGKYGPTVDVEFPVCNLPKDDKYRGS